MTALWSGLLLSERAYRTGDPAGITALRNELREKKRGLVTIDPGASGAVLVFDDWWRKERLSTPYAAFPMTAEQMVERAAQAADEAHAAVMVVEAGYLNVRQPSSLETARRAGMAVGAIAAHLGYAVHVVSVQPQTWQSFALDLPSQADSRARKLAAVDLAASSMAKAYATTGDAQQRSGYADAWCMGWWWQRAPLQASPIRR